MPFGFERMDHDAILSKPIEPKKVYVDVKALQTKYGKIIPLSIIWHDGREFDIDKVIDCLRGRSTKKRTSGYRYTCKIGSKQFYLFFDEIKWYVEINR